MRRKRREPEPQPKQIHCAIYTRKSTEEDLEQEFNSLDAQRDRAEKYIASQAGERWVCLPDQYDDGGFTGGNMERPALQRLLADIDGGKIDCVVVYKVDRLSRSILDFAKIVERFEQHHVSFVSVTQQFNTTHSMGRLTLNILLSFAQFEREIISERTRDKIAAARRRGKWMGGKPLLGYDLIVLPGGSKLAVNDDEADRVRAIFELYLDHERIAPVLMELDRRAWRTKQWTTRRGTTRGGRPFDKVTLFRLLTNPAYLGKVRHREDLYDGEHDAIVDEAIWQRAQALLERNGRTGGRVVCVSCWDEQDQQAYAYRRKEGLDLAALRNIADCFGTIDKKKAADMGYERLSGDAWIEQDVEILIPAALEHSITGENVQRLSKRIKLMTEGANGPTTPEADHVLQERGIFVIPDFLADAGGVTCSYLEQVQSNMNYFWEKDEVLGKLDVMMTAAFIDVSEMARKRKLYTRDAAYTIAIARVAQACKDRGWV